MIIITCLTHLTKFEYLFILSLNDLVKQNLVSNRNEFVVYKEIERKYLWVIFGVFFLVLISLIVEQKQEIQNMIIKRR